MGYYFAPPIPSAPEPVYLEGGGPGGNNNVLVINTHAGAQDIPVLIENGPDGLPVPVGNTAGTSLYVQENPTPVVGNAINFVQEAVASGGATVTLTAAGSGGPFGSFTALNPTNTDFSVQIGTTHTSALTVKAGETISLPLVTSELVITFTAALQHVVALQSNPLTT